MIKDGLTHFNLLYDLSSNHDLKEKNYINVTTCDRDLLHLNFILDLSCPNFFLYFARSSKGKFICANTTNKYSPREGLLTYVL